MKKSDIELGEVILNWDEGSVLEGEYKYYQEERPEILVEDNLPNIERFGYWMADNDGFWEQEYEYVHTAIWEAFESVSSNRYVEFITFRPYHYAAGLEYVKDWDALRRFLHLNNYTEIKVQRATYKDLFPALVVTWRDYGSGEGGDVLIVNREDSVCPICETEYAHDSDAGEKERAFIRKWGRCPDCVEEAIVCFCQGDRTDDTSFLYQPGDYLMWWRLDLIRSSFAELGSELSEEAEDALWHVQRYSAPGYVMYGR